MQEASRAERRQMLAYLWALIRPRRANLFLGLLLVALNRGAGLVLPASSKYLVDNVMVEHQLQYLPTIVLSVLGAMLVQGATSFGLTQILSKEVEQLVGEVRRQVQQHVNRLPIAFYDATKTGTLVSRIMTDIEGLRNLLGTGPTQSIGSLFTGVMALVILIKIDVIMTLISVTILSGFLLVWRKAFARALSIFGEARKINAELSGRLTESLGGIRLVKGYHAEDREHAVFSAGVDRLLNSLLKARLARSLMDLCLPALIGIVSALVMCMSVRRVFSGSMTVGIYVTYSMFLGMMVGPLIQLASLGAQLSEATAGLDRIRDILREKPEDEDRFRTLKMGRAKGRVDFENVTFSYGGSAPPALKQISFSAPPGTVTAFVGPSGAGKSTVIALIAAFYNPAEGRILIDGTDLASVSLESYRSQLGLVLQEAFLFDGTIRENVLFSNPKATEQQFLGACRIARVDEFAERLKGGYLTVVGERGVRLSVGQKQRVSIARALVANPRILILDEATSSLDSQSEAMVQEGLSFLMRGRTTFVIAHRLSTIHQADQILVMEEGRIIERGDHNSLYAAQSAYWRLYTKQHVFEPNRFLAQGERSPHL